ncbi:type IIL restriction-modification enzyme MmeI [Rhodobacter calidifons]|uniref:type IIL restriction-modification enzyme MmeI n=1 Tax=Rhodobacter calidifons TaxID=2715277 RepID=UPI001A99F179|nr:type IIL restriction-modification enzyme MmeI [Rhodobacter calidifons]
MATYEHSVEKLKGGKGFPYINGHLFETQFPSPDFNEEMRTALLNACRFDWTPISPAIFGSLFQSVMDKAERRRKGAHYTTEKNILKLIGPLFLDDLRAPVVAG